MIVWCKKNSGGLIMTIEQQVLHCYCEAVIMLLEGHKQALLWQMEYSKLWDKYHKLWTVAEALYKENKSLKEKLKEFQKEVGKGEGEEESNKNN